METSTETVHGVRVQRSTPVGCEQPRRASMATASVSRDVDVTVKTRVVLAPRRYGTSPFVVGSPDWRRARTRGTGYVLGAPRP